MSRLDSPLIYFIFLNFIVSTWTGVFFDFSIVAFPLPPMVNVYCCFEKLSKKTKAHIKIINRTAPITLWVIPCKYDLPKEIGLIGSIAFLISSIWFLFIFSSMSRFVSSREFYLLYKEHMQYVRWCLLYPLLTAYKYNYIF